MDKEMMRALEADGEKLRQLTGEDHGPRFPEEIGWVIECGGSMPSSPMYLAGYDAKRPGSWSTDPAHAIRFSRKIDAERAYSLIDDGEHAVRICEHIWGGEKL